MIGKKVDKLDCDKSLAKLIYSLIALYVKTKNREAKPPKYHSLEPLLNSICADIKLFIQKETNDPYNQFISKSDFQKNIANHLKNVAEQRKQQRHKGQKRKK